MLFESGMEDNQQLIRLIQWALEADVDTAMHVKIIMAELTNEDGEKNEGNIRSIT